MDLTDLRKKASGVRLILFDLDGTLLDEQKNIPPSALRAIEAVEKLGVRTSVATGRMFGSIDCYLRQLPCRVPVISGNGGEVTDPPSGRPLLCRTFPYETAAALLDELQSLGVEDYSVMARTVLITHRGSGQAERYLAYLQTAEQTGLRRYPPVFFDGHGVIRDYEAVKVNFRPKTPAVLRAVRRFIRLRGDIELTTSDGLLFETMAKGVSKGSGLRFLAKYLGVPLSRCMVFGDHENDLPMFSAAGFPVAMGNAVESIKRRALYITETNDGGGIAKAIRDLFL